MSGNVVFVESMWIIKCLYRDLAMGDFIQALSLRSERYSMHPYFVAMSFTSIGWLVHVDLGHGVFVLVAHSYFWFFFVSIVEFFFCFVNLFFCFFLLVDGPFKRWDKFDS